MSEQVKQRAKRVLVESFKYEMSAVSSDLGRMEILDALEEAASEIYGESFRLVAEMPGREVFFTSSSSYSSSSTASPPPPDTLKGLIRAYESGLQSELSIFHLRSSMIEALEDPVEALSHLHAFLGELREMASSRRTLLHLSYEGMLRKKWHSLSTHKNTCPQKDSCIDPVSPCCCTEGKTCTCASCIPQSCEEDIPQSTGQGGSFCPCAHPESE